MKINALRKLTVKPEIFTPGNSIMWTDSYISRQLLPIHLDADTDLASRKEKTIEQTIGWIMETANKANPGRDTPLQIIDLGCGPGLYSQRLARMGHRVTGVDFSENSIAYARKEAKQEQLTIRYICRNYLNLDQEPDRGPTSRVNHFDLVILLFADFGVLLPEEQANLLEDIHRMLKPGGLFIFDVLNDHDFRKRTAPAAAATPTWDCQERGFWSADPYLVLSREFIYTEEKVILQQHAVITDSSQTDEPAIYRFWNQFYSHAHLVSLLEARGFRNVSFNEDILPETGMWDGKYVTFTVARKDG